MKILQKSINILKSIDIPLRNLPPLYVTVFGSFNEVPSLPYHQTVALDALVDTAVNDMVVEKVDFATDTDVAPFHLNAIAERCASFDIPCLFS